MDERDRHLLESIIETRGGFGHREHLELAWSLLERHRPEQAHRAVGDAIRHVAASHGAPDKYHETITRFWVRVIALHRRDSRAGSFDAFLLANPELLEQDLLGRHYSRSLLDSPRSRREWIEPDLRELPVLS